MSAFLCSSKHISAIAAAGNGTAKDFKMLVRENIRSLEARYPGRDFLKEWKAEARTYVFEPNDTVSATQVIKCCNCYDYQACETDDYRDTKAAAFVEEVRRKASVLGGKSSGPEYDLSPWELT